MMFIVVVGACSGASEGQAPGSSPATENPSATVGMPEGLTPTAEAITPVAPVFSVATVDGETVRLEDLLGTVPVYVVFLPSVDDEIDRAQLSAIQADYDEFEAMGARIVMIASDLPTTVVDTRDELGLEFALIADPLNVVARDWQVFDLFGEGKAGPASFVFDAHGTLIARLVAGELDDRPTVDEVLRVIEESLSAGAA